MHVNIYILFSSSNILPLNFTDVQVLQYFIQEFFYSLFLFSFPLQKSRESLQVSSFIKKIVRKERNLALKPVYGVYLRIDDSVPLVPRFSCNREDVITRGGRGGERGEEGGEREKRVRIEEYVRRRNSFYSLLRMARFKYHNKVSKNFHSVNSA